MQFSPQRYSKISCNAAMNFLVTSLLFANETVETFSNKWNHFSTIGSLPAVSLVSLTAAPSPTSNWYKSLHYEVYCACSSINPLLSNKAGLVAQELLSQYARGAVFDQASDFSCTVLDRDSGNIWLSADLIGGAPLWYAFNKGEYSVSTDLLALYHLGMHEPNSVPPGYTMKIVLSTLEITHIIAHKPKTAESLREPTQVPELYARQVFTAALETFPTAGYESMPMVEVDPMDPASLLLDCALDALHVNRTVWNTKPSITEDFTFIDFKYRQIIESISSEFTHTTPAASVYEPSFRSVALERLRICRIAAALPSRTLLSFDAGLDPRPVKVYLQNLFCNMLNVTVVYPFGGAIMQSALHNMNHPTSYLIEALGYLRSPQLHQGLYSPPNTLYQPVCRVPVATVREWDLNTASKSCTGVGCADRIILYAHTHSTDTNYSPEVEGLLSSDPTLKDKIVLYPPAHSTAHITDVNTDFQMPTTISLPDPLVHIWRAVRPYAAPDGIIVLLLVTRGYADMLTNFLCSARALQLRHFLILTEDEEIIHIANIFNVGYYSPPTTATFPTSSIPFHNNNNNTNSTTATNNTTAPAADADFGTVRYQELIYSRTELTLQLLRCGYHPIIADVDAVWLSNPLEHLPWSLAHQQRVAGEQDDTPSVSNYDLAITDDNGEVCGCFVALRATAATLHFWSLVTTQHRDLIRHSFDNVRAFDDSEQKILTRLLYKQEYKHKLLVFRLPEEFFPSGYNYFNLQTQRVRGEPPAVVHNNFIIGKALKRARFMRYGMWSVLNSTAVDLLRGSRSHSESHEQHATNIPTDVHICIADPTLHTYANLFTGVSRNTTISSLNLYLPVHNSVIRTETIMAHAAVEGPIRIKYKEGSAMFDFAVSKLYMDNHPPSYLDASPAVFGVLNMSQIEKHTIVPYTLVTSSDAVSVSVDVGYFREVFSVDRANLFVDEANEYVLRTLRENKLVAQENKRPTVTIDNVPAEIAKDILVERVEMTYSIRIITYNRPRSLQRLLASLLVADYAGYDNVTLHIAVDAPKTPEAAASVAEVTRIANAFEWPFGPKSVTLHASNIGLVGQWFTIWTPTTNQEAAFILEDDMEVSPYFFTWAVRATEKYYSNDVQQRGLHQQLLNAVTEHAGPETTSSNGTYANTPLQEFARTAAGRPLLYGICLQKQHLDPNHNPKKLQIRNGHRPFLYSLVGSWAPFMLPQPWRAFLVWQAGQESKNQNTSTTTDPTVDTIEDVPLTERLVTNHFLEQNPRIWTPWHIRFAYETGAKCLYSNLPGDHALVVNHREAGENYATPSGPDGELLSQEVLEVVGLLSSIRGKADPKKVLVSGSVAASDSDIYRLPVRPTENDVLKWSLLHLPNIATLTKYQYDFNLRRAGAMGADRTHQSEFHSNSKTASTVVAEKISSNGCAACGGIFTSSSAGPGNKQKDSRGLDEVDENTPHTSPELALAWSEVHHAMQLQNTYGYINDSTSDATNTTIKPTYTHLSAEHWVSVVDMVESIILPGAMILHVSYSPLVRLLSSPQNMYQSTLSLHSSAVDMRALKQEILAQQPSTRIVHQLNALTEQYTLLVLDATQFLSIDPTGQQLAEVYDTVYPVEYLLVIGACSSAPTDLTVQYKSSTNEHNAQRVDYIAIEDVCSIADEDVGAVLYRDVSRSSFPKDHRFSVSRRLSEVLQTRRTVDAQGL